MPRALLFWLPNPLRGIFKGILLFLGVLLAGFAFGDFGSDSNGSTNTGSSGSTTNEESSAGSDSAPVSSVSDLIGTDGSDLLEGTDEDDVVEGLAGNDELFAKDGNGTTTESMVVFVNVDYV